MIVNSLCLAGYVLSCKLILLTVRLECFWFYITGEERSRAFRETETEGRGKEAERERNGVSPSLHHGLFARVLPPF